jgi:hypothetical protein
MRNAKIAASDIVARISNALMREEAELEEEIFDIGSQWLGSNFEWL